MTAFLCISLIIDSAIFDNGEGVQSESIEYLRSRENDKVVSESVKQVGKSLLDRHDEVYRILCTELSDADYDMDDEDSVESTIRDVVSTSTISGRLEQPLPPRLADGLETLEEILIQDMDTDPFKIVSNIRSTIRSRNVTVKDYLDERVRDIDSGNVDEIRTALRERTDSEIVACTCADAAGWWTPRPRSVPLAIGQESFIENNISTIENYFQEAHGSPTGVNLINVASQQATQ